MKLEYEQTFTAIALAVIYRNRKKSKRKIKIALKKEYESYVYCHNFFADSDNYFYEKDLEELKEIYMTLLIPF